MGVKNHIRLALLFVCIMMVGIALYPYVPRLVKIAQAVQGELKFGAAMEQEMRIVNKTFYSADMYFGNGSGGTIGVLQGTGNVGIGMGVSSTNMRTPQQRLSVADTMAITATGPQFLLMGNQGSNPVIIRSFNENLEIGKGTAWIGPGGTFTSNVFFANDGNVGIGSTFSPSSLPTKKFDVVGDINFSGGLYQGGVAFQGSKWTNTTGGIYYNSGNVGVGTTAPGETLDVNGNVIVGNNGWVKFRGTDGNYKGGIYLNGADGDFWINQNDSNNDLKFGIYGDSKVTIQNSGNVGIGTTNPQKKLDIVATNSTINNTSGNLNIVPSANLLITQGNVGIGTTNPLFKLDINGIVNATALYVGGAPYLGSQWTTSGTTIYYNTGNVGIGSATPVAKLDIGGSTSTIANVSGNISIVPAGNLVVSQGNVGIGSATPGFKLDVAGIVNATALYVGGVPYIGSQWTTSGTTIYYNTGNVGIGTTAPLSKLGVLGNASIGATYGAIAAPTSGLIVEGNVGIGTSAPAGLFQVKGTGYTFSATGGTITTNGAYTIHTFTAGGTFTPNGNGTVEVLVVGGGGGGGMDMGGGGGGGGVVSNGSYAVLANQPIGVTVGAGGIGAPAASTNGQPGGHQYTIRATAGGNSAFGALTAYGGGYGGSSYQDYTPDNALGGAGASGGGASGYTPSRVVAGGAATQGFRGGNSYGNGAYCAGGGGGAGGQGTDGNVPNGGPGIANSILGTTYYWGGGGGGNNHNVGATGNGGIGGGGGGTIYSGAGGTGGAGLNNGQAGGYGYGNAPGAPGGNGGANTGGGGGGGTHYNSNNKGGNGGSGIVVVRYLTNTVIDATLVVNSSGNVGIGTSAPTQALEVVGTALLDVSKRTNPFTGSTVVNAQQGDAINHWVEAPYKTWTLCYRKSRDGASSTTFHSLCNNKGETVTIATLSTGAKVGGYAPCSWRSAANYLYNCGGAFLFSLTKMHKYNKHYYHDGNSGSFSYLYYVYDNSSYGPTWGGGHDWYIASDMNTGYVNLGHDYTCRLDDGSGNRGGYATTICRNDFSGGGYNSWTITELETWYGSGNQ